MSLLEDQLHLCDGPCALLWLYYIKDFWGFIWQPCFTCDGLLPLELFNIVKIFFFIVFSNTELGFQLLMLYVDDLNKLFLIQNILSPQTLPNIVDQPKVFDLDSVMRCFRLDFDVVSHSRVREHSRTDYLLLFRLKSCQILNDPWLN